MFVGGAEGRERFTSRLGEAEADFRFFTLFGLERGEESGDEERASLG
jgi:hypothetical protein